MTDVQVEREKISLFHSRAKEAGNRLSTAILTISLGGTAVYFATLTGGTNSSFSIFEKVIVSVGLGMFALTSFLCLLERLCLIYCSYGTLAIALVATTLFVLLRIIYSAAKLVIN